MKILKKIFKIVIILIIIYLSLITIIYILGKLIYYFNDPRIKTFSQDKCIINQEKSCHINYQKYGGRENFDLKIIEKKLNYSCNRYEIGVSYGFNCIKK